MKAVDVGVGVGEDCGKAAAQSRGDAGRACRSSCPREPGSRLLPNVQSRHPGSFTKPGDPAGGHPALPEGRGQGDRLPELADGQAVGGHRGSRPSSTPRASGLKLFEKDEALFKAVPVPGGHGPQRGPDPGRVLRPRPSSSTCPSPRTTPATNSPGRMKNLMGLNSPASNRTFHRPNWKTDPDDVAHLEQSIVDLNKAVKPALNVVDATEFIVSNGPFGPGQIFEAAEGGRGHRTASPSTPIAPRSGA
ncbi:MAG: DUF362 domain-containing protein [Candidatus Moduliflexus flocculans]|nr:DUF362 domain-containing protein [Candidatus Moduliflexus flocculans]